MNVFVLLAAAICLFIDDLEKIELSDIMEKIAICISGQIRGDTASLKRVAKRTQDLDADIFISVWAKRGSKTFGGATGPGHMNRVFGNIVGTVLPRNWLGRMRSIFPNTSEIFPEQGNITKKELLKIFPNAAVDIEEEDIDFSFNFGDSNSLRMLYKIWRCNGLKKKAEKNRGIVYDRVIRMRPDILLDFDTATNVPLSSGMVYTHTHQGPSEEYMQDICLISNSPDDDLMSGAVSHALMSRYSDWDGIHVELFKFSKMMDLSVENTFVIQENIQKFSKPDPKYLEIQNHNFLNVVVSKNMDLDISGGDEFCDLAGYVLNKIIDPQGIHSNITSDQVFFSSAVELSRSRTGLGAGIFSLVSHYLFVDPQQKLEVRIQSLIHSIAMANLTKNEKSCSAVVGAIPEIFETEQTRFGGALLGELAGKQEPNLAGQVLCDVVTKYSPDELKSALSLAIPRLLGSNKVLNWMYSGIDHEEDAELVVDIADTLILHGSTAMRNFESAATACENRNNEEKSLEYLLAAVSMSSKRRLKARIGRKLLSTGDEALAKNFLSDAVLLPGCKPWVAKLMEQNS